MNALYITVLTVVVTDQAIKYMFRRLLGANIFGLGPWGSLKVTARRIWLKRHGRRFNGLTTWCVWLAAAISLMMCSALTPLNGIFVGLLLGSSLSHAIENSLHDSITDYICFRKLMAFNLADVMLAVGAIGTLCDLLIIAHQKTL